MQKQAKAWSFIKEENALSFSELETRVCVSACEDNLGQRSFQRKQKKNGLNKAFPLSPLSCLPLLIIYITLWAAFARYGQALVCMCVLGVCLWGGEKALIKMCAFWRSVAGFNMLCCSLWLMLAGSFQSGSGSQRRSVDQGGHLLCVWTASLDLVTSSFLCSLQSCAFKVKLKKKGMSALALRCVLKDSSSVTLVLPDFPFCSTCC